MCFNTKCPLLSFGSASNSLPWPVPVITNSCLSFVYAFFMVPGTRRVCEALFLNVPHGISLSEQFVRYVMSDGFVCDGIALFTSSC